MTGHPKPRRRAARSHWLPSRQNPLSLSLAALLLAVLLLSLPALAACGGDTAGTETTTTAATEAASTTIVTVESVTTTLVPAEGIYPVNVTDDNGTVVTIEARADAHRLHGPCQHRDPLRTRRWATAWWASPPWTTTRLRWPTSTKIGDFHAQHRGHHGPESRPGAWATRATKRHWRRSRKREPRC